MKRWVATKTNASTSLPSQRISLTPSRSKFSIQCQQTAAQELKTRTYTRWAKPLQRTRQMTMRWDSATPCQISMWLQGPQKIDHLQIWLGKPRVQWATTKNLLRWKHFHKHWHLTITSQTKEWIASKAKTLTWGSRRSWSTTRTSLTRHRILKQPWKA